MRFRLRMAGNRLRRTSIEVPGRLIELPVAARHFSAWDYAERRFAIISGAGTLRDDGEAMVTAPDNVIVVFDEGGIEVRPRYHDAGGRLTEVVANHAKLSHTVDDALGYFAGRATLPIEVAIGEEPTVRCQADLERYIVLEARGPMLHGAFVQLTGPDACRFIWTDAQDDINLFELDLLWHERLGTAQRRRLSIPIGSRAGMIEIELPLIAPPATVAITGRALDDTRREVMAPAVRLQLVYRNRDLPSLSYQSGDVKVVRILHPLRLEGCSIVGVRAEAFSEEIWRPLTLNIGGSGQHARHLEFSEEWQELIL